MFRSSARNLRTWWDDFSADILGADLEPSIYPEDFIELDRSHPHRHSSERPWTRREGSVPARPEYCLSPVSRPATAAGDHGFTR